MTEKEILQGARAIKTTIENALQTNTGAIIGRFGTVEFDALYSYELVAYISSPHVAQTLERNAGIWPQIDQPRWIPVYHKAAQEASIMAAGWYPPMAKSESFWLSSYNPTCTRVPLRSLEPYYVNPEDAWTSVLQGQKVAVVSSFADTITQQLEKRQDIWPNTHQYYLPQSTTFVPIKTHYAPVLAQGNAVANWPTPIESWSDAVQHIVKQVLESGAKIAILGCGGLAMPIAYALKRHNIISIVMGGSIQVLFGIKGKRWESHGVISKFWNPHWTYPAPHEIPGAAKQIEGGCYW